jgi:hypothetical protein
MSKTRQKRLFGMTLTQLMILGCLALAAIGTIFGGFIFLSSSTTPGGLALLPSSVPTFSLQPTSISDQSGAPGGPSTIPSVVSDEQIPSNWEQYTATTIEISVPPQFESINAETERQRRIETYRAQGFGFLADRLENLSFDYRFWFNFPQPETVTFDTHITVKADILPTITLDEYIDEAYGAGLQGFQVLDRQDITIENLQARRILLEANLNDQSIGVAEYIITDEVNLWIISSSSSLAEFYSWLPEFDRVARSFRLLY